MPRLTGLIREGVGVPPSPDDAAPSSDATGQASTDMVSYRRLGTAKTPPTGESDPVPLHSDPYRLAEDALEMIAAGVREGTPPDIKRAKGAAAALVESLLDGDGLVRSMWARQGMPVIGNMVNVAILATRMAAGLGWSRKELEEMALAGLLHDIGMFRLPERLITNSRQLTADELGLLRQHPQFGYEMVSALGAEYEWLAQVIIQEHERWHGGGYPKGLKEDQIIEYAFIIGIVDVFDALVSARPYRRRFFPHEAVQELLTTERKSFPSHVVKCLIHEIGPFPVGMVVRLNSGDVCTVKARTDGQPFSPLLEVCPPAGGEQSRERRLLDLSRLPLMHIATGVWPDTPLSS